MPQATRIAALAGLLLFLSGCESLISSPGAPSDFEALQEVNDAYLAYDRGDCDSVLLITEREDLEVWEANEIRHSLQLLEAFCHEIQEDVEAAREIYDELIALAPTSFAASDAWERVRVLDLTAREPAYQRSVDAARERARTPPAARAPVKRYVAEFPPLAQQAGIEGFTVVEFSVNPRGRTANPVVVDSHPPFLFDGTSVRAIRGWEYARRAGTTVNERQVIRLVFRNDLATAPQRGPKASETTDTEIEGEPTE
jgi:TonB family protein